MNGDEPLAAADGLFAPDLELRELDTGELLAMVPSARVSVLRRGRALLELGSRASDDTALLRDVAVMIRELGNRRLITVGAVSVSQLGTAGFLAGGGGPAVALAPELAAEWPAGEQSDFEWLMASSRLSWPHDVYSATPGQPAHAQWTGDEISASHARHQRVPAAAPQIANSSAARPVLDVCRPGCRRVRQETVSGWLLTGMLRGRKWDRSE